MKHDEERRGLRGLLIRLGALLAALGALIYLLWKRRRGQEARPAADRQAFATSAAGRQGKDAVRWRRIALIGGALMVAAAIAALTIVDGVPAALSRALPGLGFLDSRPAASFGGEQVHRVLQEDVPAQAASGLAAEERQRLHSYGWVSEEDGIAHIPIARAMDLLVTTALPARTPAPTASPTPSAAETPAAQATAAQTPSTGDGPPQPAPDPTAAARGEQLFSSLGCDACHPGGDAGTGPALTGLFGREVTLQSGETVVANEAYVRRSILHPGEQVVAGYADVMPGSDDQLSEQELDALLNFIRSLD